MVDVILHCCIIWEKLKILMQMEEFWEELKGLEKCFMIMVNFVLLQFFFRCNVLCMGALMEMGGKKGCICSLVK